MNVNIELHEPYQDDRDTTDEEGVGMEPGAYNEAANSDDDVLILALANRFFFLAISYCFNKDPTTIPRAKRRLQPGSVL